MTLDHVPTVGGLQTRRFAFEDVPQSYFWVWMAMDWQWLPSPPEGWQEIPIQDPALLIAGSQLSRTVVAQHTEMNGKSDIWVTTAGYFFVETQCIEFATLYPVILAHQAAASNPIREPSERLIGTHCLIFEQGKFRIYTLSDLGDAGKETWTQLQQLSVRAISQEDVLRERQKTQQLTEIEIKEHLKLWKEAQLVAHALTKLYWQLHITQLEHVESQRILPQMKSVLHDHAIIIPQLDPVEGVLFALAHARRDGGWEEINAIPTYTHKRPTSITEVSVRPLDAQVVSADITGQLWQHVRQFSDVDGDIFLAMLAQYLGTSLDTHGGVWIAAQQILEYRGIEPKTHKRERLKKNESTHRRAGHRYEDMKEIADGVNRIRNTHLTVHSWKESHKRKTTEKPTRRRVFKQESYLITISDYIEQSQLLSDDEQSSDLGLAVAWYFQPGSCLVPFLTGPNYRAAWVLQLALKYDPYHEMWEKRLARYFTFQMRMNAEFGGTKIRRSIGTFVNELSLPINPNDPSKTKERFEKAMRRLVKDGIISQWGPEDTYEEAMKQRPRYNWLEGWLSYEIDVWTDPLSMNQSLGMMEHLQNQRKLAKKPSQNNDKKGT